MTAPDPREARYEGRCEFCAAKVVLLADLPAGTRGREEGLDLQSCPACAGLYLVELWRVR